jgi:predicted Zn-dependent protease
MRIWAVTGLAALTVAGCAPLPQGPHPYEDTMSVPIQVAEAPGRLGARDAARNFITVVERLEPVTEDICRARTRGVNCDFRIVIDDRPGMPPNAFQTLDPAGRPILGFSLALIGEARNGDEIAFVLAHEASHHILGHIPQQQQSAVTGAVLAGILASATGAGPDAVRSAQEVGASMGARTYSKRFELEADALGAEIAWRTGYDPVIGTGFFDRLPDPGDRFMGTHPANAQRKAVVRQVVADMTGGI